MNLHPIIAQLVADPRMTVRVPPPHIPLERIREAANKAMARGPSPDLASIKDIRLSDGKKDVPVRVYRSDEGPAEGAIVFVHGGGFVWGSLDTHDGLCRRMAVATGQAVVSVDYRLSPEASFPAAEDDVVHVAREAFDGAIDGISPGRSVSLCGDSAGGYLACHAAGELIRTGNELNRLVLLYPALDPGCGAPSHIRNAQGPVLTSEAMKWFWSKHGLTPEHHLRTDRNLGRYPPTFVLAAEFDPLHDEAERFASELAESGVDVEFLTAPGLVHGFLSLDIPRSLRDQWESRIFARLR
ncbi:MAG: alpha/beta hydrolase [Flavobacteriaceae bacterium]